MECKISINDDDGACKSAEAEIETLLFYTFTV
jgi:hypothetical protein